MKKVSDCIDKGKSGTSFAIMNTKQYITTTSGQTYKFVEVNTIGEILAYTVILGNGKIGLVYKYASGLIKKVTKGL